jgi:hypothetical protein
LIEKTFDGLAPGGLRAMAGVPLGIQPLPSDE